ncbi:MAG: universal stress protein [Planctomycetes bacterium]|nr:universal stress protein [Planctomycetota bacterium]
MLRKILVPLDGSELADRILTQVRRLLVREDAEVMLLRVLTPRAGADAETRTAELEHAAGHLEERWKALNDAGAKVRFEIMEGDPAEQILVFANGYQPSLIAMSTHGRTGLDRVRHGSVAERVLRRSAHPLFLTTPLALAGKKSAADLRFHRVVVPLDGSDASAAILPLLTSLANLYESEIVIVHAVLPYPDFAAYSGIPGVDLTQEARAGLEPYRQRLEREGLRARVRICIEHPATAILEAAQEEQADLVAMTTHGRSGLSRWVFGSIAEKVLHHVSCPMLVLRTSGFAEGAAATAAAPAAST